MVEGALVAILRATSFRFHSKSYDVTSRLGKPILLLYGDYDIKGKQVGHDPKVCPFKADCLYQVRLNSTYDPKKFPTKLRAIMAEKCLYLPISMVYF